VFRPTRGVDLFAIQDPNVECTLPTRYEGWVVAGKSCENLLDYTAEIRVAETIQLL